jgi:hypothetical protein
LICHELRPPATFLLILGVTVTPELEQIRQEVERVISGYSELAWHQAPPGKWTSAQIFEHLLLTYTGTTKGLRRVLESGHPLASAATLPHRVRKFVVTKLGWMPAGRTAFKQICPADGLNAQSMRRFYDALVAMDATLLDAERRFGKRAKLLDHPFLGPLNAQEWRLFHRTHTRHHLKQVVHRLSTSDAASHRPISV